MICPRDIYDRLMLKTLQKFNYSCNGSEWHI